MNNESASNIKDELVTCKVVGFIDIDYTYGIVFPISFTNKYKRQHWKNFKRGNYDTLMVTISLNKFNEIEKEIKKLGFIVKKDSGLFNTKKISKLVNQNKKGLGIFLKLISFIIVILGSIISFYTIFWMLKNKGLEFSLYRFFGSSNIRILLLYGAYLSIINVIAISISYFILNKVFYKLGSYILTLKEDLPSGFQAIFSKDFLLEPLITGKVFFSGFFLLEIMAFSMILIYLAKLNKKL